MSAGPGSRLAAWTPALLWAGFVFAMSGDAMSGDNTRTLIDLVLRYVLRDLPATGIASLNAVIRKLAHVSEYSVFVLLLERGLDSEPRFRGRRPALWAFGIAVGYSLTDEAHQALVPSRTASIADCAYDSLGAALGGAFVAWRGNPLRRGPESGQVAGRRRP